MILSGQGIREARERGELDVFPWGDSRVNPNSYNLRLAADLLLYRAPGRSTGPLVYGPGSGRRPPRAEDEPMDLLAPAPPGIPLRIPDGGLVLYPGNLYLGSTLERTRSGPPWVPLLEGRSGCGRRGLSVHVSAGFGDVGFDGTWTLELTAVLPVRVYAGAEVCQVYFVRLEGPVAEVYSGSYQGQTGPRPAAPGRRGQE